MNSNYIGSRITRDDIDNHSGTYLRAYFLYRFLCRLNLRTHHMSTTLVNYFYDAVNKSEQE